MPPVVTDELVYVPFGTMTHKRGPDGFLYVSGRMSDDTLDLDKQIVDPEWLDAEAPEWFKLGNTRVMHQPVVGGKAKELVKNGNGWDAVIKVTNPQAAIDVEEGALTGLSIGIKGARTITDADAPNGRIVGGKIVEVSLVDRPANPSCKLSIAKMAGDVLTLEDGIEIEKADKVNCPTCKGDGKINDGNMDCPDCDGSGKVTPEKADSMKNVVTDAYGWSEADRAEWTPLQKQLMPDSVKKDYSDKERASLAASGAAMPGGGYPISTVQDLRNAIQAFGRAKDPAATKAHIKSRAKALGHEELIPDNWKAPVALAGLVGTLTKAATQDQWMHDPTCLAGVRDGLISCITTELGEFSAGEDESWDISQLTESLNLFLSWWQGEASEGETPSPFQGDDMSMTALGVSADLMKAASAETATDDDKNAFKTALREALAIEDTTSIKEDLDRALKVVADYEERLATVEKMAAPSEIHVRAQMAQQTRSAEADELETKALRYRVEASRQTEKSAMTQYLEAADAADAQAAALRVKNL